MSPAPHSFGVVLAICLFSAIGGLVFNTMPILLATVSQALTLTPGQLGTLSLTAGLGYLAGTITGPFWVDRVNWRLAGIGIVVCVVASFSVTSQMSGAGLYAGFAGFGFFCALALALGMRVLADMPDPERAYGTRLSAELFSIGIFLSVLPVVFVARAGFSGAMMGMAAFALLLGLGALLIPKRSQPAAGATDTAVPTFQNAGPALIVLVIFTVFLIANVGLFFFLGVIAGKFDPSPQQFGLMFGGLKWLGGIAGAIGAIIGARAGLRLSHTAALIILLAGLAGLFMAKDFTGFMIASWVWEFGFTLACLYQTAAIARFDKTNKLIVLVPMAFAISMIVGGKLTGEILGGGGSGPLYAIVAAVAVLPALYILIARPDPEKYKITRTPDALI